MWGGHIAQDHWDCNSREPSYPSTTTKKLPSVSNTKKRNMNRLQHMLPTNNVGQREGPAQNKSVEIELDYVIQSTRKSLVLIMARYLHK